MPKSRTALSGPTLLVRGDAYLDDPLFWPVHLGSCLRGEDAQRAAFVDEWGVDYLIHQPTWSEAETLAVVDGHFMGPGMAWPELLSAARQSATEGIGDADARLLLLFPCVCHFRHTLGQASDGECQSARQDMSSCPGSCRGSW